MTDNVWVRALAESELPEGVPVAVEVEGNKLLLLRRGDQIHACGNECSHYRAPLSDGLLAGHIITCPWHNARFDVRDGSLEAPPGLNHLPSYETRIEAGQVLVRPLSKGTIPMPAGHDERTFLIVGGGAAGNSAAETLRREGFAGRIVMVTAEPYGPYDRTMLSKDYLSGEAPAKWLPLRGEKFYERLQIELLTGKEAVALDPASRSLTFADGSTLGADALLLATGAAARKLPVPGADKAGCFTLRSRRDADAILAALEGAEKVVVVGAGFIGLEAASALRVRGLEVRVTSPGELPLARVFGREIGGRIRRLHESKGVKFHLGTSVQELAGDGRVREVLLSDGSRLEADCVLVGVGLQPAVGFLRGSGLVRDGVVPVDARLATEAEGVFAAGDIALLTDSGEPRRSEHWVEAQRQAKAAASCMLGSKKPYREVPFFWSRQHGLSFRYLGHAPAFDSVVFRGDVDDEAFIAGYYRQAVLKAVSGLGRARELIRLGQLLEAGGNLAPEKLGDPDFDLLGM